MRTFRILCPRCGRRVLDALEGVKGAVISVKCPRCKMISIIDLLAMCRDPQSQAPNQDP